MSRLSYKTLFIILLFLLIPIVFLIRINQKRDTVSAAWWSDNWNYRQSINISAHTSAESDVYISTLINLDTASKAQTDAGDFRFLDQNGNLLSYYVVSGAGTTAISFHIQLTSFPSGAQTIYSYYGNSSVDNGFSTSDFSTEATNYTIGSLSAEEVGGGPIAWWKFDEGVGTTVYDSSPSQLNGNLTSGTSPTWISEDQCISGKCLNSSYNSHYRISDNKVNFGTGSFSINMWVKPQSYTYPRTLFPLKKGSAPYASGLGHEGWSINDGYSANGSTIVINDGTNKVRTVLNFDTNSRPPDFLNKWTHLVYVFDRTINQVSVYVNGVKQSNTVDISSVTGSVNTSDNLYVGYGTGWGYQGFFDDIRIYPYARTAEQIKQDYAAGGSSVSFGSNSPKSLSDGLVGYWKMDEGIGTTIADSSGNNNIATFATGDSAPSWSNGKFGIGISFNGINNYGYIPDPVNGNLDFGTSSFSLSTWLYFPSLPSAWTAIINKGAWALPGYGLSISPTNQICADIRSTGGTNQHSCFSTVSTGVWQYITVVFDRSNLISFYKNGLLIGSAAYSSGNTGTIDNSYNLNFGRYQSGGYHFNGLIDEFRIYNRALSTDEVKQLYNYSPGPVGYWKMDEGIGTTAYDISGNGYNSLFTVGSSAPNWTTGKIGNGLNFTRYNKNTTASVNIISKAITYSAWYKFDNLSGIQRFVSSNAQGYIQAGLSGNQIFVHNINSAGTDFNIGNATLPTSCQTGWHYLTITRDSTLISGNVKVYCDGIQFTTGNYVNALNGTFTINSIIFGYNTSDQSFDGSVDEIKIYNYAQTQSQILQDMQGDSSVASTKIAGPIAWYKFDEGQGSVANNSGSIGSAANGNLGSGTSSPTWASGKNGKSLSFDGNDEVIAPLSITGYQYLTYSAWVKSNTNPLSLKYNVVSSNYGRSGIYITTSGKAQARAYNTQDNTIDSTTTVIDGSWHHILANYDQSANQTKLYIDGKLENQMDQYPTILSASNTYIGRENPGTAIDIHFSGLIDDVKIYNYSLSADEIKADYNSGASAVFGVTNLTVGSTSYSAAYCIPGSTDPCSPPVAEWNFEEGVGTTAYDTSGIYKLPLGSGDSAPSYTVGKFGKSLDFSGNDYVGYQSTILSNTGPVTVESWIKTNTSNQGGIVSRYGNSGSYNYRLYIDNTGKISFSRASSTVTTTNALNDNKWHHVVGRFDLSTSKIYVDGIENNSVGDTNYAGIVSNWWFMIGNDSYSPTVSYGHNFFTGLIDNVRIYNYARTPAQIAWDYNQGAPVAWWKMDECQGTTIHDSSTNQNHGTLNIGASGSQTSSGTCTTPNTAWGIGATGKFNSSLSFDSSDDYIQIPTITFSDSSPWTFSSWLKWTSSSSTTFYAGKNHAYEGFLVYYTNNFAFRDKNGVYYSYVPSNPFRNLFTHVTWVADGSGNLSLYLNGQFTKTTPSVPTQMNFEMIGRGYSTNGYNFGGQIDDVRIYNYALTSDQIKTVYNNGAINFN